MSFMRFNKFRPNLAKITVCLVSLIVLLNPSKLVFSQSINDTSFYSVITESMTNSDVELLGKIINSKVDIVLPDQSGIYSKHQSKFILKSFFDKNKPESFHLMIKNRNDDGGYFIGKLHTANKHYRVCFLTKRNQGKLFIYQIRIEE